LSRTPVDDRALVALPGLDDDGVARREAHVLASLEHVVVEVALAREPHPAALDDEVARLMVDANRLAEVHRQTADRSCVQLRVHHQSPG
jgi:hypothetical protein